ncbi:MAG: hypothetical protein ACUVTD_03180 [Nitrososphaerales archaeon]
MGCWRWFNSILKEAGVAAAQKNRAKIDKVIHELIGAKAKYEHCSSDWMKVDKKIRKNEEEKADSSSKVSLSLVFFIFPCTRFTS